MIKNLIHLIALLLVCNAFGQHPIYTQFSEKEDLPDIEFYNILEDSKGFIWLAADKGFYRYDGNKFKLYTNKEKRGLSVFEPKEDHLGRIWCCNVSGQFFYTEDDKLNMFIDLGKETNWQLGSFFVTKKHLLVFTGNIIYKISLDTKEIELRLELREVGLLGNPYLLGDKIYITNGSSIVKLDLELNILEKITSEAIYKDLTTRCIGKSYITSANNHMYLSFFDNKNESNIYLFDVNTGQYDLIELEDELKKTPIISIDFYKNQIFLSTYKGLWVYTQQADGSIAFKNTYFEDEYISRVILDKSENYWVTTLRSGVYVIPNINNLHYDFPDDIKDFTCIQKINDEVFFFGTANGKAGFYNIRTNTVELITLTDNSPIRAMAFDKARQLLYVSQQNYAFVYDIQKKKAKAKLVFQNVNSLSYMEEETFMFANFRGAIKVKDDKEVYRIGVTRGYIGFHDTISKNSYISYVDNFIKYDQDFKATAIRYKGKQIYAIGISKTDDGIIWASTFKDGLFGIKEDQVVANYTVENGLTSNFIKNIKGDGNQLWIVTDKSVQLLDVEKKTFKTLTKSEGISTFLVSGIEIFGDLVLFATNKGIFSIDKTTAFQQRTKPEIYFTNIQINEKDTLLVDEYQLPYSQNAIKFSFNSNGFRSKEHIQYFSRLVGFNDNWIPVDDGIDFVKYNSLPVGNYTFQVKAVSKSLAGTSEIKSIVIAIQSPFWERPWFIGLLVISTLLFVILYYRNILKKRDQQKNEELEKLAQERELVFLKLENLRSQMNPHFIFNALNSIQEYIILNKKNLASDYLGKFADLIRTYLNHSAKGAISLQDEIDCLEMYLELEKLRFEDKLTYTFQVDSQLDTEAISIPTMLIQPYVENALKHGLLHKKDNRELNISLETSPEDTLIICTIEDNGVGREKALAIKQKKDKIHTSFGTKATQDRLDLLNYGKEKQIGVSIEDLQDDTTEQPIGTRVVITIPITKIKSTTIPTT